ncbi:protein kinase family protein [Schinkia azotoformans MEV2011]|uniref:Protein kinase family protein n=1 Tax=Schinkia azotoformans MEV2011 TaxID=1348973 RepID=A0A072NNX9_SCHAZ|nr:protein kinase [Schinkia azotoformans]KEF39136.1 protein kinase family protein [Schinkia azotoformans MEV2011]MEC1717713.1 protein kinase [Schinkia azotoformans]MEC1740757.1 protein kinase [Schinkia azotoformans]MEC1746457.1 protein kinase [Schinkia azotoformans]MEC1758053.1 protein kinase [Schinkia azotoformans]
MVNILIQNVKSIIFDRPIRIGTIINDRYIIIKVLGMGSYGITYLTYDQKKNIEYVLKQMKPSRKKLEKVHLSFQYEKEILTKLNHPRIPKFGESITFNGHHFFTMEYVNGKTFEDLIFKEGIVYEEHDAFCILREVLEIVAYLHGQNIIHRDLRIPNIMVKENIIYVIDFGLARFFNDMRHYSLHTSMNGYDIEKKLKREIHFKSDFYALGHFILFLLYSGYSPESKKEKSWEEELRITEQARFFIRRLLQLDEPYTCVEEVIQTLDQLILESKLSK